MRSIKELPFLLFPAIFTSLVILPSVPPTSAIRSLVDDRLDIASSTAASAATSSPFSWQDEQLFIRRDDDDFGSFSPWNITGTYRGTWDFVNSVNASPKFLDFERCNGTSILELVTTSTKISGVHYARGTVTFQDAYEIGRDQNPAHLTLEGVYIWPFRKLRLVTNSGSAGEADDSYFSWHPYHLLEIFSSEVFPVSSRGIVNRKKKSVTYDIKKHCNLEIAARVSQLSSGLNGVEHERYHFEGLMESSSVNGDGECFPPIQLNTTSLNIDVYFNKAVNYTLMVTFISFLQVLILIRQMEHSNTQSGASKVSIVMIGQQAIMDAYLCLLHLTAGILIESLFNAFATAAFFKFVVFSVFEMRYLLAIWKASRPINTGEGWETMRRELSVLYSRFYGILLGGILVIYELHNFMRPVLFILYSFWLPQIVSNILNDTRKPLHPHYIVGITVTRLAIPFYMFGCPSNFIRIEIDTNFCMLLGVYMGSQMLILLLQHYFGSRCFIPRQILPEKYSYIRGLEVDPCQGTDCVICMTAIDSTQRSNDCMVTPCDHFFHTGCLQRWMDIKMECPTCRRPLPPA